MLDRDVEIKSDALKGFLVGVGVCGGIAALESVRIIRELRRYGATVRVSITPSVRLFMTPLGLEWASGHPVIEAAEANVDHLESYDGVLVVPATLNTISKISSAICDNPVTLLVASQLGRKKPVAIVPTMNVALSEHPMLRQHQGTLVSWGVDWIEPALEEGRWKIPDAVELVASVIKNWKVR